MTQIGLDVWLKLLIESGVQFSSPGSAYSHEAALKSAERLGLELEQADMEALRDLGAYLSGGREEPRFNFLMNLFRHQQSSLRAQKIPARHYPKPGPVTPVPVPDVKTLPPWGNIENDLCLTMSDAKVPIDWKPKDSSEPDPKKWDEWVGTLVEVIATKLWPIYCAGGWVAGPDVGPLLDADFQILEDLRDYHGLPIKGMFPSQVLHRDMFIDEDDNSIDWGSSYDRYDCTLPPNVLKEFPNMVAAGMADKVGTLDLQLKMKFQRPRAHQMAVLQNRKDYTYAWARSGNTPSLVAGHALQSTVGVCTAFLALDAPVLQSQTASIAVLKQFAVDIGDRRVFAGVHYPSDNLASWFVAFNLLPRVFAKDDAAKATNFLWDALAHKSQVFQAIVKYKDRKGQSPYEAMLAEVRTAAGGR